MAQYDIKIISRECDGDWEGIDNDEVPNHEKVPTEFEIKSIVVKREVNKIPSLEIVFIDVDSNVSNLNNGAEVQYWVDIIDKYNKSLKDVTDFRDLESYDAYISNNASVINIVN